MRSLLRSLLLAAALLPAAAAAEGIAVYPIRLELQPGQKTASLTVTNDTAETKVMQVSAMGWRQANGQDVFAPAGELVVTPALFRVPPRGRQLVRVGFPAGLPDAAQEHSYRVFLQEVPETRGSEVEIRLLLRFSLPLFLPPARPVDAVDWSLADLGGGRYRLSGHNRGNRHLRISRLQLVDGSGKAVAERRELAYLLAGSRAEWPLQARQATGGRLRLRAETGRGMVEAEPAIASR